MPEIEKMIRWSALNVSRRKPASSAAIDIYRTLVATDSDQSPCRTPAKAESCANEKNSTRRLYDNLAGVVFSG